ncbi:MAG TPA: hypothetical protein VGW77_13545 [Candidatus Binatia bacterium]|jgi:hypothetical protein|nr:hypothetical protein [Candidatus Binatia bacterium]
MRGSIKSGRRLQLLVSLTLQKAMIAVIVLALTAPAAFATTFNTNDINTYNQFATGATVQNFESIGGMTALGLTSYTAALNGLTTVGTAAQLGLDINGLLFHSGGGSFNNPVGNPGTPTALLQLNSPINGDAHSPTNVVGSLAINTETLDIDNFIEVVFITSLQNRVGFWLNPALGNVLFTAFDSTGTQLESIPNGTAGNFLGIERLANDIKFISIIGLSASGFTIDDLTYGQVTSTTPPGTVPEANSLWLLVFGLSGLFCLRHRLKLPICRSVR